jgi:betaine-homocysteine S-methyltransferase
MLPLLKEMRAATKAHHAAQPVAYRTSAHKHDFTSLEQFPTELDPLQLSRSEMAGYAREALATGVNYIGACCGAVATHIRAMAVELGKRSAEEREWRFDYAKPMSAVEYYKHAKTEA